MGKLEVIATLAIGTILGLSILKLLNIPGSEWNYLIGSIIGLSFALGFLFKKTMKIIKKSND